MSAAPIQKTSAKKLVSSMQKLMALIFLRNITRSKIRNKRLYLARPSVMDLTAVPPPEKSVGPNRDRPELFILILTEIHKTS